MPSFVAAHHNVSAAQVALRWVVQRGAALVTGTANPKHMASDLDLWGTPAAPFELSGAEMSTLNALQPHDAGDAAPPRTAAQFRREDM